MARVKYGLILLVILLLGLLADRSVTASPQHKGTSTLTGVVIGPDDKPVPHASVTYQSSGGNAPHAVHTDAKGRFTVTQLRADNYDVRASANGIFSEWEKNVNVRPKQTKSIMLTLIYAKTMPKTAAKSAKH